MAVAELLPEDPALERLDYAAPAEDLIGNEAYRSLYSQATTLRIGCCMLSALLLVSVGINYVLAHRQPIVRYIRIDSVGRATPIQYSDLDYSPQEAEVNTLLQDWARYSYSRLQRTIFSTYPKRYKFIDKPLAAELMSRDLKDQLVARIATGQIPENDITLNGIQFLAFPKQAGGKDTQDRSGQAEIDFNKTFTASGSDNARSEHWKVQVSFYLSSSEVNDHLKTDPEYQFVNPLGLVITDLHEARMLR